MQFISWGAKFRIHLLAKCKSLKLGLQILPNSTYWQPSEMVTKSKTKTSDVKSVIEAQLSSYINGDRTHVYESY